ncbi:MAG TPA: STAS domain-containing protein [Gammaproteobacteria bacterium]
MGSSKIPAIVKRYESELLAEWVDLQRRENTSLTGAISQDQLHSESASFLRHFVDAVQNGATHGIDGDDWSRTRDVLENLSRSRARQGFTPSETAFFVFSLKQPLFARLQAEIKDGGDFAEEIVTASKLIDRLGLHTVETFQKSREDVIRRQQEELLELSTPVIHLWDGILAVPLIGTLDSARTQVVMESLLTEIVSTGAGIAVIDITGVPTVDTIVAQHLLKTVAAARLMGAECIISGIRPQIAQTIVHLGVHLGDVITKASLADAFRYALRLRGQAVEHTAADRD